MNAKNIIQLRHVLIISILMLSLSSYSQTVKELYKKVSIRTSLMDNGDLLESSVFGKKIDRFSPNGKKTGKYKTKENKVGSKIYSCEAGTFYFSMDVEHSKGNIDVSLLRVDKDFKVLSKVKSISATQKVGEIKYVGLGMVSTIAPFMPQFKTFNNGKYTLAYVTKYNPLMNGYNPAGGYPVGMPNPYKVYAESNEKSFFALYDEEFSLVTQGGYDFGIQRGSILNYWIEVNENGDLIIAILKKPEIEGSANVISIVKIKNGDEVTTQEVTLGNHIMNKVKMRIVKEKLYFTGWAEGFDSKRKGVFKMELNTSTLKEVVNSVILFNEDLNSNLNREGNFEFGFQSDIDSLGNALFFAKFREVVYDENRKAITKRENNYIFSVANNSKQLSKISSLPITWTNGVLIQPWKKGILLIYNMKGTGESQIMNIQKFENNVLGTASIVKKVTNSIGYSFMKKNKDELFIHNIREVKLKYRVDILKITF